MLKKFLLELLPAKKLCTTKMWGINFMRCPRKFPTCISNDVSNNSISRYPICFSLGGIKEQLNRLTAWPSSFKQKSEFLTVYCVTLPQKETNSLFKETVMLISLRGVNNFIFSVWRKWTYTKHGPRFIDHPMDLVNGPGPPLIFKRKSPLLI